jgi:hypothetical protein
MYFTVVQWIFLEFGNLAVNRTTLDNSAVRYDHLQAFEKSITNHAGVDYIEQNDCLRTKPVLAIFYEQYF